MRFRTALAILGASGYALGAPGYASDTSRLRTRRLATTCIGNTLEVNDVLEPNQSICINVNGEDVWFGIYTYRMDEPGYIMYRVELRSSSDTYNRSFSGIGTQGDPPKLKFQGDGNLVFGGQSFSGCIAEPGTQGGSLAISEQEDDVLLQITDSNENVVWKLGGEPECYPNIEDFCVSVLDRDVRLSWKEYLCSFDSEGKIAYKFGLSRDAGLLGLWKGSTLIWRPTGGNLRGDYLHFQDDGHLTLYKDTQPKQYIWTSDDCIDFTANKLVLTSDGDVQELNYAGAIVWTLLGSRAPPSAASDPRDSVPELCMPRTSCVILPTTPLFVIDDDVDIGDTLDRPGPAFAASCGPRCYDVKDNGDDPPFDPHLGDTLRFAYKEITSSEFFFRAKVCGTKCDGEEWRWGDSILGRSGLMVRESLDPMSKNLFVSHQPHYQADWSYRLDTNGGSSQNFDGSPDVECLWITLERHSQERFTFSYSYESHVDHNCGIEDWEMLNTTITIPDMAETVLVGLGVSTGVSPPFCRFTEARFSEIQLES
jgi:hypothetical protein